MRDLRDAQQGWQMMGAADESEGSTGVGSEIVGGDGRVGEIGGCGMMSGLLLLLLLLLLFS